MATYPKYKRDLMTPNPSSWASITRKRTPTGLPPTWPGRCAGPNSRATNSGVDTLDHTSWHVTKAENRTRPMCRKAHLGLPMQVKVPTTTNERSAHTRVRELRTPSEIRDSPRRSPCLGRTTSQNTHLKTVPTTPTTVVPVARPVTAQPRATRLIVVIPRLLQAATAVAQGARAVIVATRNSGA